MREAGDAYVYFTSPISNKPKYHICTLELDTCQYIIDKLAVKNMPEPRDGYIRAFCWDLDDFKNIDVSLVTSITPLATVLRNSVSISNSRWDGRTFQKANTPKHRKG